MNPVEINEDKTWWVYLIRCGDQSLYCGITTDVPRRFEEHQSQGPKAAKYLRGRTPLTQVYQCEVGDQSAALREEYRIKRLSRVLKEELITSEAGA